MSLPLFVLAGLTAAVALGIGAARAVPRIRGWWAGRAARPEPMVAAGDVDVRQLYRLRWMVRAALGLAVTATVAANILHAQPSTPGRIISAWAPVALLITIEIMTRVPVRSRARRIALWLAVSVISAIAAWVSYWHMAAVAARYGEDPVAAHLIPLSVDALVVITSVYLIELSAQIRTARATAAAAPDDSIPAAVAKLLPAAMEVARRIAPNGTPPSGRALRDALRAAGHGVASDIVSPLTSAVAARWDVP